MEMEKAFLGLFTVLLVLISFVMASPFIGYLLTALIISFVLHPVQERLRPHIGESISAVVVIVLFTGAIFMPFALGLNAVLGDASEVIDNIDRVDALDFSEIETRILEYTGQDVDIRGELEESLRNFTSIAVGGFSQILNVLSSLIIGAMISLFAVFYLLRDGDKLHAWMKNVTPVNEELQDRLYNKASLMTWSVLKGHVLVAIVTGLIGGIGLYATGVPNVAFWTFIMILLCFIPIIGAFLVWAPASAYLFLSERPLAAAFLFFYGLIVVSLADNILRPYLVDKRADIHPAAILLGVIGGVYVFGAVGLFLGPIIFGFSKTVLEVFMANYEDL